MVRRPRGVRYLRTAGPRSADKARRLEEVMDAQSLQVVLDVYIAVVATVVFLAVITRRRR